MSGERRWRDGQPSSIEDQGPDGQWPGKRSALDAGHRGNPAWPGKRSSIAGIVLRKASPGAHASSQSQAMANAPRVGEAEVPPRSSFSSVPMFSGGTSLPVEIRGSFERSLNVDLG